MGRNGIGRRALRLSCLALGLPVIATIYYRVSSQVRAADSTSAFLLTQQEILKCDNDAVAATIFEARSADGSRSTVKQSLDGVTEKYVRKADGTMMRAYDHIGVRSTIRLAPDSALAGELTVDSGCMQTRGGGRIVGAVSAGSETILGFTTVKILTTGPGVRITAWHSPTLGCLPVRRIYEEKNNKGVWHVINVLETLAIRLGDPPASFFASGGSEMAPSAAVDAAERHKLSRSGLTPADLEARVQRAKDKVAQQDRNYLTHRPE